MITVEELNAAFSEAAKRTHEDMKASFEARYGKMSDGAFGMLLTLGLGGAVKLNDGTEVTGLDVALLLDVDSAAESCECLIQFTSGLRSMGSAFTTRILTPARSLMTGGGSPATIRRTLTTKASAARCGSQQGGCPATLSRL